MKKILKITNSDYCFEYNNKNICRYRIKRHGEDITDKPDYNIVFNMMRMILEQQEEIKKLKSQLNADGYSDKSKPDCSELNNSKPPYTDLANLSDDTLFY